MPTVSAAVKALTTLTAEERLKRLRHQNTKLRLEISEKEKQLAPVEQMRREVLLADMVVKQQLLAMPFRLAPMLATLSDVKEIHRILAASITEALNDLAYSLSSPEEIHRLLKEAFDGKTHEAKPRKPKKISPRSGGSKTNRG